jgi:hypothetical protein
MITPLTPWPRVLVPRIKNVDPTLDVQKLCESDNGLDLLHKVLKIDMSKEWEKYATRNDNN